MKSTPTLDPFGEAESESPSLWGPILIAIILGIATSAGVLYWRWPSIGAPAEEPSHSKATTLFKTKAEAGSKNWDFYTSEVENLMKELQEQKATYEQRTRDLGAVEKRIEIEKKELERIKDEIKKMREDFNARSAQVQGSEKSNLRTLAGTYSNMKPIDAAAILAQTTETDAAKILSVMKKDASGKILGEMARMQDPSAEAGAKDASLAPKAAKITEQIRLLNQEPTNAQ
ncbi:MAG: MotE family protein [Terrimicrobiaceae bacterium]